MLLLLYASFLALLLGIIWLITGIILLIVALSKKADLRIPVKMVVISFIISLASVLTIHFSNVYLEAHTSVDTNETVTTESQADSNADSSENNA